MNTPRKKSIRELAYDICHWCGRRTNQLIQTKTNSNVNLTHHTDHIIPWCFSRSNAEINLVVSCNFCNQHKNAKVFDSDKQVREWLKERWYAETNEVFTMLTDVRPEEDLAAILLKGMPLDSLARRKSFRVSTMRTSGKLQVCENCGKRKTYFSRWPIEEVLACSKECLEEIVNDD